jgi:AcrR family transcriptional regulator
MRALGAGGPDAVRVEALAKELGVSKGGFYWHFDDRQALIEETLDSWEKTGTEDVIVSVDSESTDPRARLRRLYELAPTAKGMFAVELALRDSSRRDPAIARRIRRVDERRMTYLRSIFRQLSPAEDAAEARALLAYSLFVGTYFIASTQGKKKRAEILQRAIDQLL